MDECHAILELDGRCVWGAQKRVDNFEGWPDWPSCRVRASKDTHGGAHRRENVDAGWVDGQLKQSKKDVY